MKVARDREPQNCWNWGEELGGSGWGAGDNKSRRSLAGGWEEGKGNQGGRIQFTRVWRERLITPGVKREGVKMCDEPLSLDLCNLCASHHPLLINAFTELRRRFQHLLESPSSFWLSYRIFIFRRICHTGIKHPGDINSSIGKVKTEWTVASSEFLFWDGLTEMILLGNSPIRELKLLEVDIVGHLRLDACSLLFKFKGFVYCGRCDTNKLCPSQRPRLVNASRSCGATLAGIRYLSPDVTPAANFAPEFHIQQVTVTPVSNVRASLHIELIHWKPWQPQHY